MSASRAVARVGEPARPTPPHPMPARAWLSVVPPVRTPAPRAPFVVVVGLLLTTGLGALLFLHTALAEDSFYLHDLTARSVALAEREQALEQELAYAASPQRLAMRARALGMVRSENPVFIRTADAKILGVPKAGVRPPAEPKPKPSSSAAAIPGPTPTATASATPTAAATAEAGTP